MTKHQKPAVTSAVNSNSLPRLSSKSKWQASINRAAGTPNRTGKPHAFRTNLKHLSWSFPIDEVPTAKPESLTGDTEHVRESYRRSQNLPPFPHPYLSKTTLSAHSSLLDLKGSDCLKIYGGGSGGVVLKSTFLHPRIWGWARRGGKKGTRQIVYSF